MTDLYHIAPAEIIHSINTGTPMSTVEFNPLTICPHSSSHVTNAKVILSGFAAIRNFSGQIEPFGGNLPSSYQGRNKSHFSYFPGAH